jgi:predicted peptidase
MKPFSILFTALFFLQFPHCDASENSMPRANQTAKKLERKIVKKISTQYLLYLPKDYDAKGKKRWPLILFLHGAGERGTNVNLVTVHGPPKLVKEGRDFPFIIVSPQCPAGQAWSNDTLLALLDHVTEKLKVDPKRVYLTGLSLGGFGTWNLGLSHPGRFAAIAPICGGGDPLGVLLAQIDKSPSLNNLKTLPIWAFHGAKDDAVKLSESERMIASMKRIGNEAKLTVYPNAGHDSWTETYNNPELYKWFLEHQR